MDQPQVIVVGAGPAGIAGALALKDAEVRSVVVDRAEQVASSWRGRYDRLRLNTCRPLSHLPKRPFPKGTPMFPTRDQLVDHIERHADEEGIDIRLGTRVDRIDRKDGTWLVTTSNGEIATTEVVISTGYENRPFIPSWEGLESFGGQVLHSSQYRNPDPYRDMKALVVGPGCSGMEIAYDLSEGGAGKVWLSARTPPNIMLREGPGGLPGDILGVALLRLPARVGDAVARFGRRMDLGDLGEYGLPVPEEGVFSRLRRLGVAPTIVDEEVIDAIKDGRIEIVPRVETLDSSGVNLAGGGHVEPDVLICATGFLPGLEPLVGHLGVLDERGRPRAVGEDPPAPRMRFLGYVPRPGGLGYMGKEARRIAKAIARELRDTQPAG